MLMDGRFARPRFSFAGAKKGTTRPAFMANALVLAARLGARVFSARVRAPENYDHINCETGLVKGKGRGGACLSVFRYSGFVRSI
jgi:hypothetical protein